MCMLETLAIDKVGGALGIDPFGTRARQKEDARNLQEEDWKRDDMIMDKQHAHELKMADKQYGSGTKSGSKSNTSKNYGGSS